MKKLIGLIKTEGKSNKEISDEMMAIFERKGFLNKDDKPQSVDQKKNFKSILLNLINKFKKGKD